MSPYLRLTISTTLLVAAFQNCANKSFNQIPLSEKTDKISRETVFPPGNGTIGVIGGSNTGEGTIAVVGTGGTISTGGTIVTGGTVVIVPPGTIPISVIPTIHPPLPISFVCSDKRSDVNGSLATATSGLVITILTKQLQSVCSFTSTTLRDTLLGQKQFPTQLLIDNCPNLVDGLYVLRVRDATKDAATNLVLSRTCVDGQPLVKNGIWTMQDPKIEFITDRNPNPNSPDGSTSQNIPGLICDRTASPLVIHMNAAASSRQHLELVSQKDGVLFDILGKNSYDTPHAMKRISWHKSNQYLYIVLPDASGRVTGIDQMFGDNTFGPDGKFALNGYHALSKYDGKSADGLKLKSSPDNQIDMKDEVYFKLRVWQDKNFDGVASSDELFTLNQAGISIIDLKFDPRFYEIDGFGNETRYKSVVQTFDGKLHLMFDLWFKYSEK